MSQHPARPRPSNWTLALPVVLACVAWFLYQRHFGLHPTVFADEWYYSKLSRLMPLEEAILPSWLYLWIFGASAACGDGFLECVRVGNLAFFLAAAPFVYLVTRRFAGAPLSFLVAVFSALAPLNIYTAYFMPESTYYLGFWVLSWVALARPGWPALAHGLALGVILGMMSLVKVHALFLIPALCLYLVYAGWNRDEGSRRGRLLHGVAAAAAAAACTLAVKFGLGWLLAGDAGLSLLGPFYQGAVNSGGEGSRLALLNPAFVNGRGHLAALATVYGVPLAILAWELCTGSLRRRGNGNSAGQPPAAGLAPAGQHRLLHVYTVLMLGAAAGMTIAYTATLVPHGKDEILRLHLRYYSFVFPLLMIVAAAAVARRGDGREVRTPARLPVLRWAIALALCGVLVFAMARLPNYALSVVDGPDIATVFVIAWIGRVIAVLQCALLLAWAARMPGVATLWLFVMLPATLVLGLRQGGEVLGRHAQPGLGDRAGALLRSHVPPSERGKVVVAGTDMTVIMRVQFHLDNRDSAGLLLEPNAPLQEYQIPPTKKWLLTLGDIPLPDTVQPLVRTPYYSLVRLPEPEPTLLELDLSRAPDPQVVSGLEGLSHPEPWGRWSDAKRVRIEFAQPLPRRTGITFSAKAYEVNTTLPFTVRVGGDSKQFRLDWFEQHIRMHFNTDGNARSLEIEIPQPVSPEQLGRPGDPRKLGIGISRIVVTDGGRPTQAAR